MKKMLTIAGGTLLALILLAAGCSAVFVASVDDAMEDFDISGIDEAEDLVGNAGGGSSAPASTETAEDNYSFDERQAISSAELYLKVTCWSRSGLIDQLEYEGFSTATAGVAVDSLDLDYLDQAVCSGQSYLNLGGFSKSGLIDQLEYEGFSTSIATQAVEIIWSQD